MKFFRLLNKFIKTMIFTGILNSIRNSKSLFINEINIL